MYPAWCHPTGVVEIVDVDGFDLVDCRQVLVLT